MKQKIASYHGSMLMFYQMVIITLVLWPVLFFFEANPTMNDWQALLVLALLTTAIGHTLFVMSFKNFSISTASIMSSVQPIYGILFGLLLLNEVPALSTLFGGFLILTTVVIESIHSHRKA
jgi:drug/metabolite transporter (DMT)-like permease